MQLLGTEGRLKSTAYGVRGMHKEYDGGRSLGKCPLGISRNVTLHGSKKEDLSFTEMADDWKNWDFCIDQLQV
jgi:hypothetical protein